MNKLDHIILIESELGTKIMSIETQIGFWAHLGSKRHLRHYKERSTLVLVN